MAKCKVGLAPVGCRAVIADSVLMTANTTDPFIPHHGYALVLHDTG